MKLDCTEGINACDFRQECDDEAKPQVFILWKSLNQLVV